MLVSVTSGIGVVADGLREQALLRRFVDHEVASAQTVGGGCVERGVGDEVDCVLEAL